jgi:hypothetical protein
MTSNTAAIVGIVIGGVALGGVAAFVVKAAGPERTTVPIDETRAPSRRRRGRGARLQRV